MTERWFEKEYDKRTEQIKKSIENYGKKLPDGKMILYHGTSERFLPMIKKHGLLPRGKKKSNWEVGIGKSRPDLVYLTTCYACYFASHTATDRKKDRPVVLKIEIDPKDFVLYPDEEFIFRTMYGSGKGLGRKKAIELYESINPKDYGFWKEGLEFMGTVCVNKIPAENIVGYAVGKGIDFLMNCDCSISPINYKFCSTMYIDYLEKLKYKKL